MYGGLNATIRVDEWWQRELRFTHRPGAVVDRNLIVILVDALSVDRSSILSGVLLVLIARQRGHFERSDVSIKHHQVDQFTLLLVLPVHFDVGIGAG